jgi:ribonucleotide monophosphatase NagD (HAD superfamily)
MALERPRFQTLTLTRFQAFAFKLGSTYAAYAEDKKVYVIGETGILEELDGVGRAVYSHHS